MARITIDFDGFDKALERFEEMEKDIKPAVEKGLKESHRAITPGAKSAISPHHVSGATAGSLRETSIVEWSGNVAEIKVGFNIAEGGLPSVFLMYGTPKMRPDMKLWSAFFGSATLKRIRDAQEDAVMEELSL
jgi:hypothetical protein